MISLGNVDLCLILISGSFHVVSGNLSYSSSYLPSWSQRSQLGHKYCWALCMIQKCYTCLTDGFDTILQENLNFDFFKKCIYI